MTAVLVVLCVAVFAYFLIVGLLEAVVIERQGREFAAGWDEWVTADDVNYVLADGPDERCPMCQALGYHCGGTR